MFVYLYVKVLTFVDIIYMMYVRVTLHYIVSRNVCHLYRFDHLIIRSTTVDSIIYNICLYSNVTVQLYRSDQLDRSIDKKCLYFD